ncbi:predicted protein [Chaetomium globosum CBS 148.51]|uniref:Uncharacterized protein n=1 Tax=Chaetomium globosum (strain ATCC 6205 / CBS 148.51 / DSM 1962 / NBRC 6347 / NRRL 1970) TaxID=306901 RepID=Q2GWM5_CHAGB|nr:uncharacterized protein CHGG_07629 [Chaetomium globosum CBS 148.51]EAQ86376.1 predicted protein [Chaetomium globosum CBS 148.51]
MTHAFSGRGADPFQIALIVWLFQLPQDQMTCGTISVHSPTKYRILCEVVAGLVEMAWHQTDSVTLQGASDRGRSEWVKSEELTADSNPDGSNRPTGLLVHTGSPGGSDACLRVWRGTRDCRTPSSVVFGPTVGSKMGEDWNSDTTGLLLCSTRYQSHDCTACEEDPRLADGHGEAADVQLSQEARAGNGGLKRPRSEARRPPLFVYVGSLKRIAP